MRTVTTVQLAALLGIDYAKAGQVINLAIATGQAKLNRVDKEPGKKGKGTNVYDIPDTLTIDLTKPFPVKETAPEATEAVAG